MPNTTESTTIAIIDTSILTRYLRIPNHTSKEEDFDVTLREFKEKRISNETLMLPMATIIETGNHIGHIIDGNKKRAIATLFVELLKKALSEEEPFTLLNFWEADEFKLWIHDFPNRVCEMGLGDLSIIKDWEKEIEKNKRKRVYIWSVDTHLQGYDNPPSTH